MLNKPEIKLTLIFSSLTGVGGYKNENRNTNLSYYVDFKSSLDPNQFLDEISKRLLGPCTLYNRWRFMNGFSMEFFNIHS